MGMNVVNSGNTYQIYGDSVKTYNQLPIGTYDLCFHKMMGFFLTSHNDLVINEEKIYGSSPSKVEKVLRGFEAVNRNFGVILSGKKGIGKSLFARQLAIKAKEYNLPVIIVPSYYPGVASFISSIEQEVIVLFDEFEKTFSCHDGDDPQEEMLSLFDGIDSGKKLFIITCNEVNKLNSYFINRPGRFHYHFTLNNPSPEEIREYMFDKLKPEFHHYIQKLVGFSMEVDFTYDMLRAIAFELNMGYSFEETIADLNISKEGMPRYKVRVEFADGAYMEHPGERFNTFSSDRYYIWFDLKDCKNGPKHRGMMRLGIVPSEIVFDMNSGEMTLDVENIDKYIDDDYYDLDNAEEKAAYDYYDSLKISKISFTRIIENTAYKYLV